MSGQSANLSLKEAREMQKRIQHSGSHAHNNGGSKGGSKKMVKSDAECGPAEHQK
jgi:hypothetical protein